MKDRRTQLLALVILVGALACAAGYSRLSARCDAAAAARRELVESKSALADIARANGGGTRASAGQVDISELNRRLCDAATSAGIADRLTSIEPGQPNRIPNADYNEMLVFLRLEPLSLRQLTSFLHELATSDRSSRAKSIELGTPAGTTSVGPGDAWSADITVAYLTYSAREESSP